MTDPQRQTPSDTPRTDAAYAGGLLALHPSSEEGKFARQLERELAEANLGRGVANLSVEQHQGIIAGYVDRIAALEQRLAAAEHNAAVGAAIQRAAKELPYGVEVEISVEQGAGTVVLRDGDGNLTSMDVDSDNRLAAEINAAIDAALKERA